MKNIQCLNSPIFIDPNTIVLSVQKQWYSKNNDILKTMVLSKQWYSINNGILSNINKMILKSNDPIPFSRFLRREKRK